jgi:glutathione S-transferase
LVAWDLALPAKGGNSMKKSKWLAGDTVTIADIAVAAPMHVHKAQRLPLADHSHVKRWTADVEELPCWRKTQGTVDRALRLN